MGRIHLLSVPGEPMLLGISYMQKKQSLLHGKHKIESYLIPFHIALWKYNIRKLLYNFKLLSVFTSRKYVWKTGLLLWNRKVNAIVFFKYFCSFVADAENWFADQHLYGVQTRGLTLRPVAQARLLRHLGRQHERQNWGELN